MWIEKVVSVERDEPADQAAKGGVGLRLDRGNDAAERVRQIVGAQRQPRDDAETAPAASLEAPVEVRVGARVGDPYRAVSSDDLGFEEICGGGAELFGVAAEAAGQYESGDAHGQASASLHVTAGLGRDLVVGMAPDRAWSDADRRLWSGLAGASVRDERIVSDDRVHPPSPDQERVRRVRAAEVAMPATFDDQAKVVLAREVDGGDHVRGRLRGDGVDARLKGPAVDPAGRLRQPYLIADGVGIFQLLEQVAARGAVGRASAILDRGANGDQAPARLSAQRVPLGRGGPAGITGADARGRAARQRRHLRFGRTSVDGRA